MNIFIRVHGDVFQSNLFDAPRFSFESTVLFFFFSFDIHFANFKGYINLHLLRRF